MPSGDGLLETMNLYRKFQLFWNFKAIQYFVTIHVFFYKKIIILPEPQFS